MSIYKHINSFLFHAQYLEYATDCIISIIGKNKYLLHKLSENLGLDEEIE